MNEAVFFTLADVHKGGIDAGKHVFNRAQIDIANLIATLGNDQFINPFIREHCCDAQLLGDDDLLRHGKVGGSPAGA